MILETNEGYGVLNNDLNDMSTALKFGSIAEFLQDDRVEGDIKKVFLFKSLKKLYRWFGK